MVRLQPVLLSPPSVVSFYNFEILIEIIKRVFSLSGSGNFPEPKKYTQYRMKNENHTP